MNNPSLPQRIKALLSIANEPLSICQIHQQLPDYVEPSKISSALAKMLKRNEVTYELASRILETGRKIIKRYICIKNERSYMRDCSTKPVNTLH